MHIDVVASFEQDTASPGPWRGLNNEPGVKEFQYGGRSSLIDYLGPVAARGTFGPQYRLGLNRCYVAGNWKSQ